MTSKRKRAKRTNRAGAKHSAAVSMETPRPFSLVRFTVDDANYPFRKNGVYVFFGEISNMPQHCVVADHESGRIYSGYHTENFVELSEDET